MIVSQRHNTAKLIEQLELAIKKSVAGQLDESRGYVTINDYGMEENPDQKRDLTMDKIKELSRKVQVFDAMSKEDGKDFDKKTGSVEGKTKTLLQFDLNEAIRQRTLDILEDKRKDGNAIINEGKSKQTVITLGDGEEFEIDTDTLAVIKQKTNKKQFKKAKTNTESMFKLINKVLRK